MEFELDLAITYYKNTRIYNTKLLIKTLNTWTSCR